jgi:hypothetical protein
MNRSEISILLLMAGSSMVWGADTKENLNQARAEYRQAVSVHGEKSPEAIEARRNLRQSRRTFHETRRERQRNRQHVH